MVVTRNVISAVSSSISSCQPQVLHQLQRQCCVAYQAKIPTRRPTARVGTFASNPRPCAAARWTRWTGQGKRGLARVAMSNDGDARDRCW